MEEKGIERRAEGREQERYPMCNDQPAQIDCRVKNCIYHSGNGDCENISPAMTLLNSGHFNCWSFMSKI
jgi:hypothetical protein